MEETSAKITRRESTSPGNDKRTSVLGAMARTQEEGREAAGDQPHRAFGHGDDHGLTLSEMRSHEGFVAGK